MGLLDALQHGMRAIHDRKCGGKMFEGEVVHHGSMRSIEGKGHGDHEVLRRRQRPLYGKISNLWAVNSMRIKEKDVERGYKVVRGAGAEDKGGTNHKCYGLWGHRGITTAIGAREGAKDLKIT